MLASPSTSGHANRSCFMRPVNLNAEGFRFPRRHRPEIDDLCCLSARPGAQARSRCRQAGIPRFDRRQRQGGRDGSVDGVAAGIQHRDAGLGRASDLRHDDAALPLGGWLRQNPVLGEMGRRNVGHRALSNRPLNAVRKYRRQSVLAGNLRPAIANSCFQTVRRDHTSLDRPLVRRRSSAPGSPAIVMAGLSPGRSIGGLDPPDRSAFHGGCMRPHEHNHVLCRSPAPSANWMIRLSGCRAAKPGMVAGLLPRATCRCDLVSPQAVGIPWLVGLGRRYFRLGRCLAASVLAVPSRRGRDRHNVLRSNRLSRRAEVLPVAATGESAPMLEQAWDGVAVALKVWH